MEQASESTDFELRGQLESRLISKPFAIVAACFLISGFAALLYETVWLRQFAILLGTSEQALAIVLASYMGGLAVGSFIASRFVDRVRRPLLTYGFLELAIAVSALLVPVGLEGAAWVQRQLFGGLPQPPNAGSWALMLFSFSTALALILIPTAFMGATLPLLARHVVHRDEQVGPYIGVLYAVNTAGAVLGTMAAAFICLPALGLKHTTWVGAAANAAVFLLVFLLVRQQGSQPPSPACDAPKPTPAAREKKIAGKRGAKGVTASKSDSGESDDHYRWVLLAASASGAISFCAEIVFTRMLGHFLGGSIYAFATMLSGFLLGIAIGGALASRLASGRQRAAVVFVYSQAASAVCTLFAFGMINTVAGWSWRPFAGLNDTTIQVLVSIMTLLPTAICVGASFPLAIRIYARDETEAASGSARVYGWNVVGGIVGALVTGIYLLPMLQYHGTTAAAVFGNVLISLSAVLVLRAGLLHAWAPLAAAALLAVNLPTAPDNVIRVGALTGNLTQGRLMYNHVGKSATVSVFANEGMFRFQTNGLPESGVKMLGSGGANLSSGAWLAALPPRLRPSIESMLIVGLGGGNTAAFVPPSVQQVDVIELEPAVIEANREIAPLRAKDPLSDARVRLIVNDGRNALALTSKRYDSIVSQPSHPWTAGASHLYTAEFAQLVRSRLSPGGIFIQWINARFLDQTLIASMAATMTDVFPHVQMYEPVEGFFMFAGSDHEFRWHSAESRDSHEGVAGMDPASYYQKLAVETDTELFAILALDQQGIDQMASQGRVITDERNLLAMRGPSVVRDDRTESVRWFVQQFSPLDRPLAELQETCPSLDLPSLCQRLGMLNKVSLVEKSLLPKITDPSERYFLQIVTKSAADESDAAMLSKGVEQYPQHPGIAFLALSKSLTEQKPELSDEQREQLFEILTPTHQLVIECVRQFKSAEFDAIRPRDAQLAKIPPQDIAGPVVRLVRIGWRLETPPAQRADSCSQAITLIDRFTAYPQREGIDLFRTIAAINAQQPLIALGTAGDVARRINTQQGDAGPPPNRKVLGMIRQLIGQSIHFQAVPRWYYRQILETVDATLMTNPG